MAEFSVDVSELLKQLQDAQTQLTGLGRSLDQTERTFQTVSDSMVNEAKKLVDTLKNVSIDPNKFGDDATAIENYFKMMSESSDYAATKMVTDLNRAALTVTALSDETHKLHGVLKNTEAFKLQEKYLKEMLSEGQKASFELAKLRREATLIADPLMATGRQQKILNTAMKEAVDYAAKQQAAYVKNTVALDNFEDSTAKYNRAAQNMLKELAAQERHEFALEAQREVSHRNLERRLQETKVARDQLNSSVAQALRIEQQKLRADQEETNQLTALEQKLHSNTVALNLYNTAKAKAARDAELALRLAKQETDASQKLAMAKKQEEIVNRQIADGTYQERERTAQLSKIKQEEIRLRERLRAVKTEEYRETVRLQQAIKQEEDAIRRSSAASKEKTKQMRIANQVAAGTRAAFAGLQTSFGMFTSATIATATAVYGVTRAIRSTIEVGTEFSASMARTAAIMGGAANDPVMFEAMENRVRSLAKITQFTAVEAAGAMTELGQAGLSAGQAMIALEPTLNLAAIGQLSMATAADHATNIMMIFGKEAQDLTHIVDVMATAVTNSNTTVDQLANALTYAGPAAESAGFSFEDTVAVTEALANSGFKASRAGTAMRRLFVSLVNPTKKGQAVLDDLNISVLNMDGSTKGLVELVNELSGALENLSDPEQLTAIQNLVGVYATSPVAALMAQTENLNKLREQQDHVSEAATRMRERIEDSLKFDARMALSAFQEAQLHVFDQVEDRLQVFMMNTANFLTSLTQPLSDNSDVTKLDEYIHRLQIAGDLALGLGAIFAAKKTSGWLTQASQELSGKGGLVDGLVSASARWREYATSVQVAQMATGQVSASATVTTAAMNAMSVATRAAASAMNALAVAMQWVGRIAMAAGVIYSAYQALSTLFGPGVEEKIERQKTRIDELAESYTNLKREAREAALREQEVFNTQQAEKAAKHITELRKELGQLQQVRERAVGQGRDPFRIDQDIAGLEAQIQNMEALRKDAEGEARKAEETLRHRQSNYGSALVTIEGQRKVMVGILNELAEVDKRIKEAAGKDDTAIIGFGEQREEILKRVLKQQEHILRTSEILDKHEEYTAKKSVDNTRLREEAQASLLRQVEEFESQREASVSKIEKHIQAEARLNQLALERKGLFLVLSELERRGVTEGEALAEVKKKLTANTEQLARATDEYYVSQSELQKLQDQAAKAVEDFSFSQMDSAEKAEYLAQQIRELSEARAEEVQAALLQNAAYHTSAEGLAQNAEFIMKLIELNQKLAGIREERAPRQTRPQKSPEELRIEAAIKLNEQLIQKYDAVGYSAKQLEKNTSDLLFAYEKGKITQEEYNRGVQQLVKDHHAVVLKQDETYQSTLRLLEAYKGGDTTKYAEELSRVISLYEKGAISAGMYSKVVSQINEEIRSGVQGPEVGIKLSPNASLFQEAMSTVIDYSQGTKKWEQIQQDHDKELALALQHQEELRAQQIQAAHDEIMDAEELSAKLTSIHEEREAKKQLISEASAQKQAEITAQSALYQESMAKMVLSSLAGSMADLVGMYAKTGEEATGAQKAAFAAQKALGVAQIILMTEVAAAQAKGDMTIPFTSTKIALANMIRAQGYASAGFAAALAIGEVSGNYSGAYDKGGYIPTGKWGIVGEYGPEIVNGPAHVTGREETARKLGGGGDSVTIAPVINVNYTSEQDSETSEEDARAMAGTIRAVVIDTIRDQMRPNGLLAGVS